MRGLHRDPVVRPNAMRVLSLTHVIYIPLYEGTEMFATEKSEQDREERKERRQRRRAGI